MSDRRGSAIKTITAISVLALLAACSGGIEGDGPGDPDAPPVEETTIEQEQDDAGSEGESWTIKYATQHTDNTPYSRATEVWADEVEKRTEGRVKVEIYYSESLLDAAEVLPGIADGRADAGFVVDTMFQNQLPLTTASSIPFERNNGVAQALAFHEMYENNDSYHAEWEDLGLHMLHFQPPAPAAIGSNEQISTLDDLSGKGIRCLGFICDALQDIGSNPVAISSSEIYEAMERGTIDGWTAYPFQDMLANQFQEVTSYVTDPGIGAYIQAATPINLDLWNSLPEDIQNTLTELSQEYYSTYVEQANDLERETCAAVNEAGVELSVMPAAETDSWRETVRDPIFDQWASQAGEGADEFYSEFMSAYSDAEDQSDYQSLYQECIDGTI